MPEIYTYWTQEQELGFHYEEFAGDEPIQLNEDELKLVETCEKKDLHDVLRYFVLRQVLNTIDEMISS
jgi:hypothetical protein